MSNSEPPYWLFLLPLLALTIGTVSLLRWPAYARSVLAQWAHAKRYEVLIFERCFF